VGGGGVFCVCFFVEVFLEGGGGFLWEGGRGGRGRGREGKGVPFQTI